MNSNYKTTFLIIFFLLILSIANSTFNYYINLNTAQTQLKQQSLPLSVDNIYTDVQKYIIKPSLVSSVMANDTLLREWIKYDNANTNKIQTYLNNIQSKYNMLATFLVTNKDLNYYTNKGLVNTLDKTNPKDSWYFDFIKIKNDYEINLDYDSYISDNLIMFINYKIFDENKQLLGATGVGIKISFVNELLQKFKTKYNLNVSFIDKTGNILFAPHYNDSVIKNIHNIPYLKEYSKQILSHNSNIVEYTKNGEKHLLESKYIKELDIYLTVEANLDDFIYDTKKVFYITISISLLLTLIISLIIIKIVKTNNIKLKELSNYDVLTSLANRRNFHEKIKKFISINKRDKSDLSFLFIDIDNFKSINDTFGHQIGDEILKEFSNILITNTREHDISARWGGEEFIFTSLNTNKQQMSKIMDKINMELTRNKKIKKLLNYNITVSAGITQFLDDDTLDSVVLRVDKAMYTSKNNGKNQTTIV